MSALTFNRQDCTGITAVTNTFIDEYMPSANGEYVKIYLYLLRSMEQSAQPSSIEAIASRLDHTTNYIMKALAYWQENGVLSLQFDSQKALTGITLLPLRQSTVALSETEDEAEAKEAPGSPIPDKPVYSLEEKNRLAGDENFKRACFVTQSYFGRPLGPSQLENLMYIYDQLHFDVDLIDYLVEYCASRGKKSMRYVEATAIGWASEGITDVAKARRKVALHSRIVSCVMQEFGISSRSLVPDERALLDKWLTVYRMPEDLIREACKRTLKATGAGSFAYADSILESWSKNNLRTMEAVQKADERHQSDTQRQQTQRPAAGSTASRSSRRTPFPQREYDMDALEKQLLNGN